MAEDTNQQSPVVTRAVYQAFISMVLLLAIVIALVYYLIPLPETVRQVLYILDSVLSPILIYEGNMTSGSGRSKLNRQPSPDREPVRPQIELLDHRPPKPRNLKHRS